jgi:hypothetical protein
MLPLLLFLMPPRLPWASIDGSNYFFIAGTVQECKRLLARVSQDGLGDDFLIHTATKLFVLLAVLATRMISTGVVR